MPLLSKPLLVAAIDFGTTYSGYAIQFKHEYEKDPIKIRAPQPWNGGKQNLMSYKTPTCLLLDENKQIDCFGFEAEQRYADLCMDKENEQYYYFRQFKMRLQEGEGLKKDSKLEDETGKPMLALKVFSLSIECLSTHLMEMLKNEGTGVEMKDILWVITVPAIWNDAAKAFMKEAAEEAKIHEDHLQIALEPEAASLYCQFLPVERFCAGDKMTFSDAKPGTVYMVADLGGGTADIMIHEKLSDNKIKEVHQATGGPWGGTAVDAAFWQLFVCIADGRVMGKFKREHKYDHLDLMKEIECVKRTFCIGKKTAFMIKFPASLNDVCKEKHDGMTFEMLAKESKYADSISFIGDKMKLTTELVASLFDGTVGNVINHISNLLKTTPAGKRVTMILMVGGFSESPYVQEQVKAKLQVGKVKILVPKEAGLSVLNGAVIYGRKPETITARVLRYTYGVQVTPEFVEGQHPESNRIRIKGNSDRCRGVFSPFIEQGTTVETGHKVLEAYKTASPNQPSMAVKIYTCTGKTPQLVADCRFLGQVEIDIPNPSEEIRQIVAAFVFGTTMLHVAVVETKTKESCTATLKLLD